MRLLRPLRRGWLRKYRQISVSDGNSSSNTFVAPNANLHHKSANFNLHAIIQSQGAAIASDEKERTPTEPAALGQPSLQLDALFLVLTAVAASGLLQETPRFPASTTRLLRLRHSMLRIAKAVLASRPPAFMGPALVHSPPSHKVPPPRASRQIFRRIRLRDPHLSYLRRRLSYKVMTACHLVTVVFFA